MGFDTANLTYTAVGSADKKTAVTAKADIGRALAELTLLVLNPANATRVPDDVHIAGDNVSVREVRDIVQRARDEFGVQPAGEIRLEVLDLAAFRENLKREHLARPKTGPGEHIKWVVVYAQRR